jgi:hypothetical protein
MLIYGIYCQFTTFIILHISVGRPRERDRVMQPYPATQEEIKTQ